MTSKNTHEPSTARDLRRLTRSGHRSTRGQPDPDKFGAELFREGGMYCREFCDAWPHNWRCQIPWPKTCFECNNVDLVHPCKKKSMWAGDFGHND